MASRLKADESVAQGIRRVARHQIHSALERLSGKTVTNRDETIHEVRKSIKKVRRSCGLFSLSYAIRLWPTGGACAKPAGNSRRFGIPAQSSTRSTS